MESSERYVLLLRLSETAELCADKSLSWRHEAKVIGVCQAEHAFQHSLSRFRQIRQSWVNYANIWTRPLPNLLQRDHQVVFCVKFDNADVIGRVNLALPKPFACNHIILRPGHHATGLQMMEGKSIDSILENTTVNIGDENTESQNWAYKSWSQWTDPCWGV